MTMRTREQLAVMLKMIEVNNLDTIRKDLRTKYWKIIAEELNTMEGSHKEAEGWKKSYNAWRTHIGNDYQKELKKLIKDLPDDDQYKINIDEDEDSLDFDSLIEYKQSPTMKQKVLLDTLVSENCEILISRADDEPLKEKIWHNIADKLNATPDAVIMSPKEWQEWVDWEKYKVPRGRKSRKTTGTTYVQQNESSKTSQEIEFEIGFDTSLQSDILPSHYDDDHSGTEYEWLNKLGAEEHTDPINNAAIKSEQEGSIASSSKFAEADGQSDTYLYDVLANETQIDRTLPKRKKFKQTPIVKSFRFSYHITKSLERLDSQVSDMKELLQQTNNCLASMECTLQEQVKQQEITNTLLKQNSHLMKLLLHSKK